MQSSALFYYRNDTGCSLIFVVIRCKVTYKTGSQLTHAFIFSRLQIPHKRELSGSISDQGKENNSGCSLDLQVKKCQRHLLQEYKATSAAVITFGPPAGSKLDFL